ncbi:uncharacterized protein [Eurosta solidaginis]|uniref:uncharacterized protein n=1 Tax=Eurosta solidaginis TaxID=178769 RepID=UPI0035305EB6
MSAAKANGNTKSDTKRIEGGSAEAANGVKAANEAAVAAAAAMTAARQIPAWLKGELFVDLLQKNIPDFKSIKSFNARPAQGAGENYATLMGLVEMEVALKTGNSKKLAYMIKLPIESVQKMMKGLDIFAIENTVYHDVIPELEQLYSDVGVKVKFAPKHYDITTPNEYGVILMEDLRQRGFRNVNRLKGLDMEHTKSALKKLAQWHAASAVRIATKGKYPDIVGVGIFNEDYIEGMKAINEPTAHLFNECMRTYEGYEVYSESLAKCHDKFFDEFRVFLNSDPNEFNVLNHGDFWSNNIMFQYDAFGKIKETYLVDFQCTRYGPPINDLYNILLSSTQYEIKLKHFEYFVKYYHDHLIECLKLLKYTKKMPTLKEIHILLYKYGIYAMAIVSGHMAIVLVDPTDSANFDNLIGTSPGGLEFKRLMYTNKRFRKHAEAVLPWLYNRGAFE